LRKNICHKSLEVRIHNLEKEKMNEFTNESINISTLPKFEETPLQPLQKDYFKVMLIQFGIVYGLIFIGLVVMYFLDLNTFFKENYLYFLIVWVVLMVLNFLYLKISFAKKGFALRNHDVMFKTGVISETTTIVTNNRVQHVALHQGMISRYFGLASIELFTAGGSSSDLKIKGLLLEDAQKIKASVSEKIVEITEDINPKEPISDFENEMDNAPISLKEESDGQI
jgi:membrane protein YdbS with pleckstrin-like domain